MLNLDVREKFELLKSRGYFGEYVNDFEIVDLYSSEIRLLIVKTRKEIKDDFPKDYEEINLKDLSNKVKNLYIDYDSEIDYDIDDYKIDDNKIIFISNEIDLDNHIEEVLDDIEDSFIENKFDDYYHEIQYKGCEV